MVIQHNMLAYNANRQLKINTDKSKKLGEKLSSGYRINRAADDAAGLAISEKMRRQIRGLSQAAANIQEGIGYVQTADGALNEVHDILHRMNELAVKSANGTLSEQDRSYIDCEVQQLKSELDRIFSTTTFNEEKIWNPNNDDRIQIGTELKQAVTFTSKASSIDVTNANCDVLAYGSYKINADTNGVKVSWKGYDGNNYETEKIDWDTLKKNNYSFDMSDYFGDPADGVNDNLYDADGNPVFKYKISFSVQESATIDDIIKCIEDTSISTLEHISMSGRFETKTGATATNSMSVFVSSFNYGASYVSNADGTIYTTADGSTYGHDFDGADDVFVEAADSSGTKLTSTSSTGNLISYPSATTVADARNSTDGWTFSYNIDGIGKVTATSYAIDYGCNDRTADDEGLWWNWVYRTDGTRYQSGIARRVGTGTLGNLMSVLTGDSNTSTPGLLNKNNAAVDGIGAADSGGYIEINFRLTAENNFSYGMVSSNNVGLFSLRFSVSNKDTEQTILDKINASLNGQTILDFYSTGKSSDYHYMYAPNEKTHKIETPVWGGTNSFFVQAGVEAGEHIEIQYDCLSVLGLGMKDTNVLTVEDSEKAIGEIKSALEEISTQRAGFGAYQNRLERAYNANRNTEENVTASESVIRDTDMAKTMVEYSNHNILLQAGQAMIAQANQINQSVLALLN